MLEYDKKEVSGSMLNKAETEIIYNALYITINFKEFKQFTKLKKQSLYKKIYEPYENQELLTQEQIKEIINKNGYRILKEIKKTQEELSETRNPGDIGTLDAYIKWMIIHYNAIHTQEPEVQEVELWRPKK